MLYKNPDSIQASGPWGEMLVVFGLSVAVSPESWMPLTVRYRDNDDGSVVRERRGGRENVEISPCADRHRKPESYRGQRLRVQPDDPTHPGNGLPHERFGRRTRQPPRVHPRSPPDGSEHFLASAVKSASELPSHVVPGDRVNRAGVEISNPKRDFVSPGLFGVLIYLGVEVVDERVSERCPCFRGQLQRMVQ